MAKTVADLIAGHDPKGFEPFPLLSEANYPGHKPRLTIVVVMVYRNAGGNIRFAVRDILLLDTTFIIEELVIVHHTDCGSLQVTEQGLREAVKARVDQSQWEEVDNIQWGANTDMAASVRGDLEWLRQNQLIRDGLKNTARGFLFDIKTGEAKEITIA